MAKLLPGFIGLGGKSKRVKNLATGEEMSRRKYAELFKHAGVTNEQLAEQNRQKDIVAAYSRPTKGRKSIQKLAPEFKETVAKVRAESAAEKKEIETKQKAEKARTRRVDQIAHKKLRAKPKNIKQSLKAGTKGAKFDAATYEDLMSIRSDAQKSDVVFSYALGVTGIYDRPGEMPRELGATIFRMRPIKEAVNKNLFLEEVKFFLEEKAGYFKLKNYWIHLAYKESFYREKATKAGYRFNSAGRFTKPKRPKK